MYQSINPTISGVSEHIVTVGTFEPCDLRLVPTDNPELPVGVQDARGTTLYRADIRSVMDIMSSGTVPTFPRGEPWIIPWIVTRMLEVDGVWDGGLGV